MIRKLTSRKLWAFAAASVLLLAGGIDQDVWLAVAIAYIGGQSAADVARYWRRGDE